MRDAAHDAGNDSKLRLYAVFVAALAVLALLSYLLVPGSGVSACNRLVFQASRYSCVTSYALSQQDASLCGYEQGTYKDSCYAQLAQKLDRVGICSSITNASTLGVCVSSIALTTSNYTACKLAAEPAGSRCAERVALLFNNQSMCAGIANASVALVCGSTLGVRYALRTGNSSYCRRVSNTTDKSLTAQIVALASQNASTSGGSTSQNALLQNSLFLLQNATYTPRDYCYTTLAAKLANSSLCRNVSPGQAASVCTLQTSGGTGRNATANYTALLAACAKLGNYAAQCVQSVMLSQAVSTKNATLCGRLQGLLSASCYSAIAEAYHNATYCSYITDPQEKSACIGAA